MAEWKTLKTDTANDGAIVELRSAAFGKGRAKIHCWRIFRNGEYAGYASSEEDAEVNFERVLSGLVHDPESGKYVPVSQSR